MNLQVLIEKLQDLQARYQPVRVGEVEIWPEVRIWTEGDRRYDGMVSPDGGMKAVDFDVQVVNGQVRIVPQ